MGTSIDEGLEVFSVYYVLLAQLEYPYLLILIPHLLSCMVELVQPKVVITTSIRDVVTPSN
jgi:hypothetical protein